MMRGLKPRFFAEVFVWQLQAIRLRQGILPFTVLRRLDCVLEGTKDAVLKEKEKRETAGLNPEPFLLKKSGQLFFNTSPLVMYGQELNAESYAICKADMLIKGHDISNIILGNTLSNDGLIGKLFDYMLSNPPFGVEWKKIEAFIRKEFEQQGFNGRFDPGLPSVSDGSLLFLMHLISRMRPAKDGGSRFGIGLNGSPLCTGNAGSGESEIRRYVLENDLVEAIIGLPTDMFYNTGISTYIWILTHRKPEHRRGKIQLIDASSMWQKMRKSLGSKRKELSEDHIAQITKLFGECQEVWFDENGQPVSRKALAAGSSSAGSSGTPSKAKPKTPAASALPLTAERADPIKLFLTWTTYGTWLPGDNRGWRKEKKGAQRPQPLLEEWCRDQMKDSPVVLTVTQRNEVENVIREHCEVRGWELGAVRTLRKLRTTKPLRPRKTSWTPCSCSGPT